MGASRALVCGTLAGALALATPVVQRFEGKRNAAYLDPVGIPTICYGYTPGVRLGMVYSDAKCDALLRLTLEQSVREVQSLNLGPLTDGELAAYGSFVYNVGVTKFRGSSIVRHLRAGERRKACRQLPRWVYAGGKVLPGLVKRRAAEERLCLSQLS